MQDTRPIDTLTNRIQRQAPHFFRKRRYAQAFRAAKFTDVADALFACGEQETLALCSSCGGHWYVTVKCRLKICPLCSFKKSKERANYLKAMTAGMQYPKMITLTMPLWKSDPRTGIKTIRDAFTKLRREKLFKQVKGGSYQIEVKIKPNGWHIHIHTLVDAPFIPQQKLWSAWGRIIGIKCPQVDIVAATNDKIKEYVCKYAAKSADFEQEISNIVRWYQATKGLRLFATFGAWFNYVQPSLEDEEDQETPKATCPHCQAQGTMFFARDGPFVYGGKQWPLLESTFVGEKPYFRPILIVQEELNACQRKREEKAGTLEPRGD